MILNTQIIQSIKSKSGLLFDKAKDFDILCGLIFKETGRTIGVNTIKRLLGYIEDDRKTIPYTLNTIALYLNYNSWEELCTAIRIDSDWDFEDDAIYVQSLEIGDELDVAYLNRKVTFLVSEIDGTKVFRVKSVENSSLRPGDILYVHKIQKGEIIEAEKAIRGAKTGNYKTNGEVSQITVRKIKR